MARTAAIGLLICFFLFHLACTSLPRSNPGDDEAVGQGEDSPQFPGLQCSDMSDLRFYFTGDAFLPRAEELIRNARDYILINVFVIIDDHMGKHIIELLKQKTEENVRVYVITDSCSGFLSGFVEGRTAVPYLVERGIPVTEYNPIRANRTGWLPVFEYRDHHVWQIF